MKLWLDDVRKAPEGWIWVQEWQVAQRLLDLHQEDIVEISLDHDLGDTDVRPLVLWMLNQNVIPDCIRIHSSNPAGALWIFNQFRDHGIGCIRTTAVELSALMEANK